MDIFCKIINNELPSKTCYEDEDVRIIMDINPDVPGHVLVIPKKHITTIFEMDQATLLKIHSVTKMFIKRMEEVIPEMTGVHTAVNYGDAQLVKHYHLHIIPTYKKDNVPNKSIEEMYKILKVK